MGGGEPDSKRSGSVPCSGFAHPRATYQGHALLVQVPSVQPALGVSVRRIEHTVDQNMHSDNRVAGVTLRADVCVRSGLEPHGPDRVVARSAAGGGTP